MKECIKVGLLGAGTVGSGVLTVLEENTAEIEKKVGVPIHVSKILVRDMKKAKELSEKYPNEEIDFKKMKESLNYMLTFKNFVMKEEIDY